MIRRQDRNNLTRDKSTLAKAPRSLTHQACTPLDAKVTEKEDGRSTATATIVASLGMKKRYIDDKSAFGCLWCDSLVERAL